MSYLPDPVATSPGATDHDPSWQLHSSTDSYLNWDAQAKTPLSQDQITRTTATPPLMSSLRSTNSTASPLIAPAKISSEPPSKESSSALPSQPHPTSPEHPVSPSYFTKHYFHAPERTSSATSPSITLTGAPADPTPMPSTQSSTLPADSDAARNRASSVSASGPSTGTPLSPTTSTKSNTSGTGFFASLRPTSPANVSSSTSKPQEGEVLVKPRRPSSVFEHVGNIWEKFGRKVHHTRTGTSEQQSGSSRARALSQVIAPIGLTPEASEPSDAARTSPSGSVLSHTSPSQSTATDSDCRTPATPVGETPLFFSNQQPLPSAPAYAAISNTSSAAALPQQDEPEELPYLAEEPLGSEARDQGMIGSPSGQSNQRPATLHRRRSSLLERVLIQVTDDNERFSVVDISGVDSADAIKERMFAKLHLFDADYSGFQLFRTEIGQAEATGPVVDDDALLVLCLQMGDDRGTLKFLVHQTAPHPNSTVRALPPPTSSNSQPRVLNEAHRSSVAGSAGGHHLRTGSQSSKSSVSDALVYPDVLSADNSHDGSNRNSTSSLTRSRAQARRVLPSAPPVDELRSPTQDSSGFAQGTFQDRRSVASSSEGSSHEWAKHGGSVSEGTPAVMIKQRSSSASTNATEAPPRRPSYVDEHGSLQASLHRQERSDDGARDVSRQQSTLQTQGLTLHNARSMDDLHGSSQSSSAATTEAEVRKQAGQDRDGRYPAASIMRPSTVAPSSLGAREGAAVHRQYSSDAQGSGRDFANGGDPRMLQRNRSAQAVMSGGQQLLSQAPMRMQSTSQIRSPPLQHSYPAQSHIDPRFNGQSSVNMQARPAHPSARPQYTTPPNYGAPGSYAAQSFGQVARPAGPAYVNEFGARAPGSGANFNTYHGHDPRSNANGVQGSLTPRPYSYHEQPPVHHQAVYRPFGQQTTAAPSPYRTREDPFTSRYFPASSSRQVSEFQIQAGRLEPGMTVQQTLRTQEAIRNTGSTIHSQAHPLGPSYGPRDPRQPAHLTQYAGMQGYPNVSAAPPLQQRPSHQPSPRPQSYPSTPATSQPSAHQQQTQSVLRNAQERSQTLPQSSGQTASRGLTQQPSSNSFTQASVAESHRREPPLRTNASERSSGSSFSSQASSQRTRPSNDDRIGSGSIEDSSSAPTTARSSQSGAASSKFSNVENRSSYAEQDQELGDDELAQIRPLPKLPSSSATTTPTESSKPVLSSNRGSVRKSEDEDTLRAGEWKQLWQALDSSTNATAGDTAISGSGGGDSGTLRAGASTPGASRPHAKESAASKIVPPRAPSPDIAPEENGTVASFGNFDDDDYESGTWAQPLDSDTNAPRLPLRLNQEEEKDDHPTLQPGEGTAMPGVPLSSSPKRPALHLTIDPAAGPTIVTPTQQRLGVPNRNSAYLSSAASSIGRSNSFARRDDDWAFRPPPEQLYDNLDDFFPKHDLDKPLLDTATVPESPALTSPKAESVVGIAASQPGALFGPQQTFGQRSRHKKSIRLVAQDRKRFLDRAEKRPSAQETNHSLLRRSSTKLWGTKVVEMTPGQEAATPASSSSAESPGSETPSAKPVFKWVKGDLIGKGTYGRVYLALNATTGEMIAVKQVELPRTASDREDSRQKGVVAALKSEIETLKDLDHPHIVSYLGFEETTQFLSIFLEYVPGGSVGSCLRKHGKFEESTIKSFLHQILEGLAYLHSKGILHRDLKADNILVDFEGICKISDFGTVRRSDDIYGNVENMSLQGSIFWMAPEVVSLSKKGYSAKIDIWSLGCVVLEMFAGRRPWSDDEAVQAMFKIGAERKAPPIPADVKLSKQAAHFLKNCFEVDPAKRPTAQRLLDHVFSVPDESWHFQQSALWRSLQR